MINQTITSTVLILFVLLLSTILEKKVNPCIKYALWLLVAVKLLIPVPPFESRISIMNTIADVTPEHMHDLFVDNIPDAASFSPENNQTIIIPEVDAAQTVYEKNTPPLNMHHIGMSVWICGIILCSAFFVWGNIRFAKYLRKNRTFTGKFQNKLCVFEVPGLRTPCLFGIFIPSIYLCKENRLDNEQLHYILEHEYTHFRHRDYLWAVVRCICVIVYWYNPFVWAAAHRVIRDSELACDAGTLKRIGAENYLPYGKTLLFAAQQSKGRYNLQMLGCSTSASADMKEMKKRITLIKYRPRTKVVVLTLIILLCCGMVGCTFGVAGKHNLSLSAPELYSAFLTALKTIPLKAERSESEISDTTNLEEITIVQNVVLYRNPEPDKVCIQVCPTGIQTYPNYYYIPEGEEQERLKSFMNHLEQNWQKLDNPLKGMKETGYQLYYQEQKYIALEGGYLYADTYQGEILELLLMEQELCDYVQYLLSENLGYNKVDITQIHDIVSAKLDICAYYTNWEFYSQTITEKETLRLFENWFGNASYILGGAECGNHTSCLELTLSDGQIFRLNVATDSCPNFGINGVYYDYRPTSVWDNREFFKCFDEIPTL